MRTELGKIVEMITSWHLSEPEGNTPCFATVNTVTSLSDTAVWPHGLDKRCLETVSSSVMSQSRMIPFHKTRYGMRSEILILFDNCAWIE